MRVFASIVGSTLCTAVVLAVGTVAASEPPSQPTARFSIAKITLGMNESEVLSALARVYNIREIKGQPPDGRLLWGTDRRHPKTPTLYIYLHEGRVSWVKKEWFDEIQPSNAAEVLKAQYEVLQELQAENNLSCVVVAARETNDLGFQSFQIEIRCGDVMIETIRDTEKGKDIAV